MGRRVKGVYSRSWEENDKNVLISNKTQITRLTVDSDANLKGD